MNDILLAHTQTTRQIEQFFASPAHALGLSGDNGAGKGYAARYICAHLLRIAVEKTVEHPYVLILDAASPKTGIDDIRELQKFLTLTVPGTAAIKRVVIIEHLDRLGHEAQNALLKTLEEPPADSVIIGTYQRDTALLSTIHSRLQRVQILPVEEDKAKRHYQAYSKADFTRAYTISDGLTGLLAAILEQQTEHPLLEGISRAREVIKATRLQRLGMVDELTKNNPPVSPRLVLDGLYRLLYASYQQSLKSHTNKQLQPVIARLRLLEQAISDLDENVQAKLVFSRLFLEF